MLVTERFVFVHIPKTAGSFIQTVLREHLAVVDHRALLREHDPDQRIWTHAPHRGLPAAWQDLPAFCVVRNPWDWYVSWVYYQLGRAPHRKRPMDASWETAFLRGETDFKEVVTRLCTTDVDMYSGLVKEIVGPDLDRPNLTFLRFERLRRSLLRFLNAHADVTPDLRRAIKQGRPTKASQHAPYPTYYDDELAQLVGERAAWFCERFGYQFHDAGPR